MSSGAPYSWTDWESGDEFDPPETGKEWLTITEEGEEMAIIVLRTDASIFVGDPEALASARAIREKRAELIVTALNLVDVVRKANAGSLMFARVE